MADEEQFRGTRRTDSWCLCMCLRVHKCLIFSWQQEQRPRQANGVDTSGDTAKDQATEEGQNESKERKDEK